jgi:endonuclease/exonuclease/phosphatase family metal-dependent hydrolase
MLLRVRHALVLMCLVAMAGCGDRRPASTATTTPIARPVCVVAYNVYWHQHGLDAVAATLAALRPDIVLLSEVPPRDVPALAQKLNLRGPDDQLNFYVTPNNPNEWALPSTAIISRFPLRDSHPIPNPGGRDFAVMAELFVDGKKFAVTAVHLTATRKITPAALGEADRERAKELAALHREWEARGKPSMIVGGDFNQLSSGKNYRTMTADFSDALVKLGKTDWTCQHGILKTRVDYILTTPDVTPRDAGVVSSEASDHRPIWLECAAVMP